VSVNCKFVMLRSGNFVCTQNTRGAIIYVQTEENCSRLQIPQSDAAGTTEPKIKVSICKSGRKKIECFSHG